MKRKKIRTGNLAFPVLHMYMPDGPTALWPGIDIDMDMT